MQVRHKVTTQFQCYLRLGIWSSMMTRAFTSKNHGNLSSGYSSLESSIQKRESLRSMKVKMQTDDRSSS